MTAQSASRAKASIRAEKRVTRTGTDPIIVIAMALGFLLTSLTTEGSQSEQYDLPGWLQALQPIARPGAMGFLSIALMRYLIVGGMFSFRYLSGPAWIAWIINLFLLIKIYVLGGDLVFFSQAILLALIQISLLLISVAGEQRRYGNLNLRTSLLSNFEASVFIFAGMFAALNVVLLVFAPQAVSTWFGRFYGVTANPQHTMMIAVLCMPVCVLVLRLANRPFLQRAAAFLTMIGLAVVVFNTGSRTGLIGTVLILCVCYFDRLGGKRIIGTLFGFFAAAVVASLAFGSRLWAIIFSSVEEQYIVGREDTRSFVWVREFDRFVEHWQFGVPIDESGRLYFSETYWLSIATNGGVIGLLLVCMVLAMLLFVITRLFAMFVRDKGSKRIQVYASGCLVVMVLATFESILAGILAVYTMIATGYLAIAWQIARAKSPNLARVHLAYLQKRELQFAVVKTPAASSAPA